MATAKFVCLHYLSPKGGIKNHDDATEKRVETLLYVKNPREAGVDANNGMGKKKKKTIAPPSTEQASFANLKP